MPLRNELEFTAALDRMNRYYRSLQEIWANTSASQEDQVTKWVTLGGAILDKLDEQQSSIEAYTGADELRIIVDQLKAMREEREGTKEKG